MIASVAGTVSAHIGGGVVVRVGGVGLAVQTPPGTSALLRLGDETELATSLVVREDSLTLYGFASAEERDLFELLQTSSGVGPRLALAVLTVHPPDSVVRALQTEDLVALCMVPGIGKKGAQRMVLELKDKVGAGTSFAAPGGAPPVAGWRDTLTGALVGLGWTQSDADETVVRLAAAHPEASDADVPALLREGLALLGRAR
ncbi:MAG: Holliday junction helicase RuvA [Frankiales bacterium]|nr:Holliday junction helicase RuvA [Frankiales bacterium]